MFLLWLQFKFLSMWSILMKLAVFLRTVFDLWSCFSFILILNYCLTFFGIGLRSNVRAPSIISGSDSASTEFPNYERLRPGAPTQKTFFRDSVATFFFLISPCEIGGRVFDEWTCSSSVEGVLCGMGWFVIVRCRVRGSQGLY